MGISSNICKKTFFFVYLFKWLSSLSARFKGIINLFQLEVVEFKTNNQIP